MKRIKTVIESTMTVASLIVLTSLIAGCATSTTPANASSDSAAAAPSAGTEKAAKQSIAVQTGGPQLWAQNCAHCHNLRSPSSYSDSQWEVVSLHMRIRANLTADEHRKILAFLKSAH